MKNKIEIPAIHDKDLRLILDKYDLAEEIDKSELKCAMCENVITWENIAALKVNKEILVIYCDDSECIEHATKK